MAVIGQFGLVEPNVDEIEIDGVVVVEGIATGGAESVVDPGPHTVISYIYGVTIDGPLAT